MIEQTPSQEIKGIELKLEKEKLNLESLLVRREEIEISIKEKQQQVDEINNLLEQVKKHYA